ncbi:facilitated trehalose transporter Tret1-like [Plutella xylostella]|uniref:facilitated trehalose transporter Tret1-like n=1 Tax=Plutella xylostella TaxID=51655 RepID=UPI002032A5CB|nr:facilitated trehalose transporter Tret1-like [Plutella xylostella]
MVAPLVNQSWVALATLLCHFSTGFIISFPSSLLPALRAEDSPIKVDLSTASWLASAAHSAMIVGDVAAIYSLHRLGRKWSHALSILPAVLGWLLVYLAADVSTIMVGRILTGISTLASFIAGTCAISEYTSPEVRGLVFSLKTSSFVVGGLVMHVLGMYFCWRTVALFSMIPLLVSLGVTCMWTESPAWLLVRGDHRRSEEAFHWLRGSGERAVREFQAMLQAQTERDQNTTKRGSFKEKLVHYRDFYTQKEFLKPLFLGCVLMVCMETSGRHIIPAFSGTIMAEILPEINASYASIYVLSFDVIALVGNGILCVIIKIFNRRTLLFVSGSLSILTLLSLSGYGYLVRAGVAENRPWLSLSLLIGYIIVANTGIVSLPLVIRGELFPLAYRESATGISSIFSTFLVFLVLKCTLLLFAYISVLGTFALFAVLLLISLVYLYYNLPETRNKTMQEIEDYFKYGRFIERQFKNGDDPETEAMFTKNHN